MSRYLLRQIKASRLSNHHISRRCPDKAYAKINWSQSSQGFGPAMPRALLSTSTSLKGIDPPDHLDESELKIFEKLRIELSPTSLEVQDISGGCGSMYGLDIVSPKFDGLSVIKQHKLVNKVLAEEIKGWHGVQLKTRAS